jgi:hypothetical protein
LAIKKHLIYLVIVFKHTIHFSYKKTHNILCYVPKILLSFNIILDSLNFWQVLSLPYSGLKQALAMRKSFHFWICKRYVFLESYNEIRCFKCVFCVKQTSIIFLLCIYYYWIDYVNFNVCFYSLNFVHVRRPTKLSTILYFFILIFSFVIKLSLMKLFFIVKENVHQLIL